MVIGIGQQGKTVVTKAGEAYRNKGQHKSDSHRQCKQIPTLCTVQNRYHKQTQGVQDGNGTRQKEQSHRNQRSRNKPFGSMGNTQRKIQGAQHKEIGHRTLCIIIEVKVSQQQRSQGEKTAYKSVFTRIQAFEQRFAQHTGTCKEYRHHQRTCIGKHKELCHPLGHIYSKSARNL